MRFILLALFCILNLTASAQFWKRKPKAEVKVEIEVEDHTKFPELVLAANAPQPVTVSNTKLNIASIHSVELIHAEFDKDAAEQLLLSEAKHNMRYRQYNLASYSFNDLAVFYVQENRFSEAKWYLLQSNEIARQANDSKHILDNLLALASIKIQIGELALAKTDLQEAHDIAVAKGMQSDLTEVNKRLLGLETNKTPKLSLRYADAVEAENSKTKIN